ncbi:tyrosine--tRNA ligase [Candidatus Peregrinibacteria bacterium]|jgi:tyrosyl-tRNA synthetase|nr:tyrosine--tRNA ligase [Candidatus Peregrinibacteria bacterium]MBT7484123.1 tyrosine--tRNA ligase [Candidatus Peregrinibacteria bacterium]MBT7702982.1 tyrosine--tRNA ligase [Candidatus Peregrinibacteria bacterium]
MSDPISDLLDRGTVEVIVREDLEKKLRSDKKLRIKLGIDPSGADLHIGHMVVIRKLKAFQDLGHHILLLFGNFTGQIGDPTGKGDTRAAKTQEELEENAKHYIDQVSKILDVDKVEVVWNADWLKPLNFADVIKLASNFTVAQMLERDMFQDRMKKNKPISLHEFMYPLMQGYDSVALEADVELGGTDQTFNLLAGRVLQKGYDQEPQNIITVPILEGLDGKIKMGKSEGNYIGVSDEPNDMYGKIMSIPDDLILRYFELATDVSAADIDKMREEMSKGANPRDLKMRLGRELVAIYHDEKAAEAAEAHFKQVFAKKELPDDIPEKTISESELPLIEMVRLIDTVSSNSEARRLIEGGGVRVDSKQQKDIEFVVPVPEGEGVLLQVGKRRFLRVKRG